MPVRKWSNEQLIVAVHTSTSYRQVLSKIGLRPTGGNYKQITKYIEEFNLNTSHFKGKAWNKGLTGLSFFRISLDDLLINGVNFQSYKLKKRLFYSGLKQPKCEICGWAEKTADGRIPVELDHKNGDSRDNRIENLRILCPNCHSLQPTHRGKNRGDRAGAGTGRQS